MPHGKGHVIERNDYKNDGTFMKGLKHGNFVSTNADGTTVSTGYYFNGELFGLWTTSYKNYLFSETEYFKG